jgi:ribosomal protein L18
MKTYKEMVEAKKEATFADIVGGRHSSMHGGAQIVSKIDGKEYVWNYVTDKSGKWEVTNEKNATAIAVSKMAGKNLKKSKIIKENIMEQKTFAPKQIDKLRKEYGNIGKMTYEQGEKLKNMVSKYPKEVLQQLAKEDIPWISMFAALRLKK